jgi:hypothetical protein
MITLLTTLLSFLAGGLPKLLGFFQDRADKAHEIALARMQIERELELRKAGFEAQARVEEIRTDQLQINADVSMAQAALQEKQALYAHDIAIGQGASTWVINARAMVRPAITYGMFALLCFINIFGAAYAWKLGTPFAEVIATLWDADTQIIWASVISFWFGSQAFSKK